MDMVGVRTCVHVCLCACACVYKLDSLWLLQYKRASLNRIYRVRVKSIVMYITHLESSKSV